MSKLVKNPIRILRITEYKGYSVLVQQVVPQHIFQFIIAKNGKFWQGFNTIVPQKGFSKKHADDDVVRAAVVTLDMAYATIEAMINPDLLKDNEGAAEVVKILEDADEKMVQVLPN